VTFNVVCTAAGTVRVSAPTTGTDLPSGYSVFIDGSFGGDVPIASNISIRTTAGAHEVSLAYLATNCVTTGANHVAVNVPAGGVVDVQIPVSCAQNPELRVTVRTTGPNAPPIFGVGVDYSDSYGYSQFGFIVPSNGAASIRIPPGNHDVSLNIPANCTASPANPVIAVLKLGSTTDVAFTVVCH